MEPGQPTLPSKNIFLESYTACILTNVVDFQSVYAARCLKGCLINTLVLSIIPEIKEFILEIRQRGPTCYKNYRKSKTYS